MSSLIGRTYGQLTITGVISAEQRPSRDSGRKRNRRRYVYEARCSCGKVLAVRDNRLTGDKAKRACPRCAMVAARQHPSQLPKYTLEEKRLASTWRKMIDRCTNPKNPQYQNYGGRGIQVCEAWRQSLPAFAAHIGPRPSRAHTLDRDDNDGHYEPGNVRWATPHVQANNKRSNVTYRWEGEEHTLAEWARLIDKPLDHLAGAVALGLPFRVIMAHIDRR